MTHTDDALTEAVAKAIVGVIEHYADDTVMVNDFTPIGNVAPEMATAAIATIRAHDEQDALSCGFCTPNSDEIRCQCKI